MMLALGFFVFTRKTLPFQKIDRNSDFNWKSNSRVGKRGAFQYLGPGDDVITITGDLYPELTGGQQSLSTVRLMALTGNSWPLIDGSGNIYGVYIINSVQENGSEYFSDGSPRKITFTLKLTQVDDTLNELLGDLYQQTEKLINQIQHPQGSPS